MTKSLLVGKERRHSRPSENQPLFVNLSLSGFYWEMKKSLVMYHCGVDILELKKDSAGA